MPNNCLGIATTSMASPKPRAIPTPSAMEGRTVFLRAKTSALPRTFQFTTISGRNIPIKEYRAGT